MDLRNRKLPAPTFSKEGGGFREFARGPNRNLSSSNFTLPAPLFEVQRGEPAYPNFDNPRSEISSSIYPPNSTHIHTMPNRGIPISDMTYQTMTSSSTLQYPATGIYTTSAGFTSMAMPRMSSMSDTALYKSSSSNTTSQSEEIIKLKQKISDMERQQEEILETKKDKKKA